MRRGNSGERGRRQPRHRQLRLDKQVRQHTRWSACGPDATASRSSPNCFGPAVNLHPVTLRHSVQVAQGKVKAGVNAALRPAVRSLARSPARMRRPSPVPASRHTRSPAALPATPRPTRMASMLHRPDAGQVQSGVRGSVLLRRRGRPRHPVVRRRGGSGSATVITVTAGQTASAINAVLPADGTITGSVTGTSASPLSGVCVSAVPLAKGEPAIFTVSGGGAYTLADLPPGRYRVEFQAGCGQAGVKTQWWQDAASSAAAKIITVSAGATVSGIDAIMTGGLQPGRRPDPPGTACPRPDGAGSGRFVEVGPSGLAALHAPRVAARSRWRPHRGGRAAGTSGPPGTVVRLAVRERLAQLPSAARRGSTRRRLPRGSGPGR